MQFVGPKCDPYLIKLVKCSAAQDVPIHPSLHPSIQNIYIRIYIFWMGVNWKQINANRSYVGQVYNAKFPSYASRCRIAEYNKIYKNNIF